MDEYCREMEVRSKNRISFSSSKCKHQCLVAILHLHPLEPIEHRTDRHRPSVCGSPGEDQEEKRDVKRRSEEIECLDECRGRNCSERPMIRNNGDRGICSGAELKDTQLAELA
jgi:hypothetical protein